MFEAKIIETHDGKFFVKKLNNILYGYEYMGAKDGFWWSFNYTRIYCVFNSIEEAREAYKNFHSIKQVHEIN